MIAIPNGTLAHGCYTKCGEAVWLLCYGNAGNGGMLAELKQGLALAGVPNNRVTTEVYFNYSAKAEESVVQGIADTLLAGKNAAS